MSTEDAIQAKIDAEYVRAVTERNKLDKPNPTPEEVKKREYHQGAIEVLEELMYPTYGDMAWSIGVREGWYEART